MEDRPHAPQINNKPRARPKKSTAAASKEQKTKIFGFEVHWIKLRLHAVQAESKVPKNLAIRVSNLLESETSGKRICCIHVQMALRCRP